MKSLRERFFAKVSVGPGCWTWTAFRTGIGYGQIRLLTATGWRMGRAHRVSFELHVGPIPDGLCVLHRCDNPACVRPDHLFLGTRTDNAADREAKGRGWTPIIHSPSTIRKAKDLRSSGATYKQVARATGMSCAHVCRVVHGQRRKAG